MKKLINEVLGELFEELKGVEAKPEGKEEVPPIRFPSWFINENLWGKEVDTGPGSQDRKLITMVGDALSGERTPLGRVQAMQRFLTDTAAVKAEGLTTQQALANLMFLDIFASVVHQFNPAVAGIFSGVQIDAKEGGGEHGTGDVTLTINTGRKGYSFKLLGKTSGIGGSLTDLINGMRSAGKETYLVVIKEGEGTPKVNLTFYEFEINRETWFNWIGPYARKEPRQDREPVMFTVDGVATLANLPVLVRGKTTGKTLKDYVLQAEDGSYHIAYSTATKTGSPIHVNNLEGEWLPWSKKTGPVHTTLDPNQTYAFETTTGEEEVAFFYPNRSGGKFYKDFLPGGQMRDWFKEETGEYFEVYVAKDMHKTDDQFFEHLTKLGVWSGEKKTKEELNEAEEEEKQKAGHFNISQEYMIKQPGTRGGSDCVLTLDRELLNEAARAYTEIISQQVFDIFNSLSDLIKDINIFYLSDNNTERKAGGTKAGTDAELLKTNTDTYIAAAAEEITDEPPKMTQENTNLNKAVDRVLKEFLQKP